MRYDYEGESFSAYGRDGRGYLLAPVYRFTNGSTGRTYDPNDCVGLLTEDGRWVRRDRKGLYTILGTESVKEVRLMCAAERAI